MIVEKPWGSYEDFYRAKDCVMKKLTINPGHQISLQRHSKRSEFWYISEGEPILKISLMPDPTKEFTQSFLRQGETVEIPPGTWHQLFAPENGDIVTIFEIQFGTLCEEDDIERLDDIYGRN